MVLNLAGLLYITFNFRLYKQKNEEYFMAVAVKINFCFQ